LTFSPTTSGEFLKTISFRHNAADTQTILNISATKFSPNFIKLENQEVYREENSSIQIALHNNEQVRAVQFDMEVPMGISLDLKTLEKTTRTNGFSITGSKIDDLTYRIILYTTSQTLLEKDNAAIFKAAISVDKSVAFGAYEFNFSNVIISDVNNANIQSISLETGTLNVTPRPITITADAATKVYGEADPALTYQITSGSLVSGDVLNGSVSRAEGEEAGDYAITSTLSNANYEITFIEAVFTISGTLDLKEENLIRSISVYPNPTSSFLKIEINNSLKVKNLLFYNLVGKEILKITKDYGVINISKFATGIYFLKINTEKGAIIKKVIKE
jgi:hypothetical protein